MPNRAPDIHSLRTESFGIAPVGPIVCFGTLQLRCTHRAIHYSTYRPIGSRRGAYSPFGLAVAGSTAHTAYTSLYCTASTGTLDKVSAGARYSNRYTHVSPQ